MDIKALDLNLLRTLDALLRTESVTAAAGQLGLSQPAMSARLARLRDVFGDPIFVPSGRRLIPTARAEALRQPLRDVLNDLETLLREQLPFDPETSDVTLRLGGIDYAHGILTPALISHLRQCAPAMRIAMIPFDEKKMWQQLEDDVLDAAIVTTFFELNDAKSRHLFDERFVFVQRKGHPRGPTPPSLDDLCAESHVLVSPEVGGFVGAVDMALERKGLSRRVVVSVPQFALAPEILRRSDLVAVLPERLALAHSDSLDVMPLPLDVEGFSMQLLWHPRRQHDPAHMWLRGELVNVTARVRGPAT